MTLGLTAEHRELAAHVRTWAASLEPRETIRECEAEPAASFDSVWKSVVDQGFHSIAIPEESGGGGGSLLEQAVALEQMAYELVPGGVLPRTVAAIASGDPEVVMGFCPVLKPAIAYGAVGADRVLRSTTSSEWGIEAASGREASSAAMLDLSCRVSEQAEVSAVQPVTPTTDPRLLWIALSAAEASGLARWCLDTAVGYAGVREQFGQPIGKFQAIKHLCAQMLETCEAISAAAWDAVVALAEDDEQAAWATNVAATLAFDGAVSVAQDCIQVLGGIGFTFEHDVHLYLRRALALRAAVGASGDFAVDLLALAERGVRRHVEVDLGADAEDLMGGAREAVRALSDDDGQRRRDLVESGLLMPHWPEPYGRGAGPLEQLAIDAALHEAGIQRPDMRIGAWAVPTILEHGTDEQRERFVLPTLRGEVEWCQLFSEPGAGSDLASLRTRAVRVDGGWELTGQKVWTSLAHRSDWGICLARTDAEAPQHKGITYFVVDMSRPGIEIRPLREMTGEEMFNEVFLDSVFVPDADVVGEINGGWRLARTTLANERVAMAGSRLGASTERCVDLVTGNSAASLCEQVGNQVALAAVVGLLGTRTTLRSIAGEGPGPESSVAKLLGVRNRQEASELVLELHGSALLLGGEGVQQDVHEALLTRCLSIAGGTTQILRNVAAERVLGLPR